MHSWIHFVACNLLFAWSNADSTPSPQFLKRAYCACVCCESNPQNCFRHALIEEDYQCIQDDCTDVLCEQLQEAKCKSSCYCEKCKDSLLFEDYKCQNSDGVIPDGCDCSKKKVDCGDESAEMKEALSKYDKIKEKTDCLVPCFCEKCGDNVPPNIKAECDKSGPISSKCSCETTVCPTQEQIDRLTQLMDENQSGLNSANKTVADLWTGGIKDAEVEEINRKLSKAINAGVMPPMTKTTLFTTKCKLQCYCDACRWSNPELEVNCNRMLKEKVHGCPSCPDNIECPEANMESNCKMYCFCLECKADIRMPNNLKDKCTEVMKASTDICPCTEKVDCNVLSQLDQAMKSPALEPSVTSEDGKPRPGKIKPKRKMWDEL